MTLNNMKLNQYNEHLQSHKSKDQSDEEETSAFIH